MKRITPYISQFFMVLLLLFCFHNEARSQVKDSLKHKKPGLYVGFSIGPAQTAIKSVGTLSVAQVTSTSQNGYSGSLEIGYLFSKYLGLSSGINFVSYKSQLALADYTNNYTTKDSENDIFEMRVTGSGISELETVNVLSIPLCVNLQAPLCKKFGFFFKGGLNMAFPMSQKYSSSGTFTYKGFYPAYNDLLENLPSYGFPTNKSLAVNGTMQLKTAGISPVFKTGFDYAVKKNMKITLGVSLGSLNLGVKNGTTNTFQLSPDATHINSFTGGSNKTTASSTGFEIGFRYSL